MAVDLDSGSGLFDRLGALGYVLEICDQFYAGNSSGDVSKELNDFLVKYDASSNDIRSVVGGIPAALKLFQSTQETIYSELFFAAQNTIIEMVDADDPLGNRDIQSALERLISQMQASSDTVDANEPSSSTTAASGNSGTAVVLVTLTDENGLTLENVYDEDIVITVTDDLTDRGETVSIVGEDSNSIAKTSCRWPNGSGSETSLTVVDPSNDGVLLNGGFESWTSSNPDNWDVTGSTVHSRETTTVHIGSSSLKITGNGSATPDLFQDMSDLGLRSNTNYLVAFSYYLSANPAAGSLKVSISDGSSTLVSKTIDLTSATTGAWQRVADCFRLTSPLPAIIEFHVEVLGPLTNSSTVLIDDVCFGTEMTQLYNGGPFIAIVGTDDRLAIDDSWTIAVTNDARGKFQTLFARMFDRPELLLPSATGGSETIGDALIG